MKIEKTALPKEATVEYCIRNLRNKKFAYLSCVTLHATDIGVYKNWLLDCEILNQDYFFMLIDSGTEYKQLLGCSSFRIAEFYDSKVSVIGTESLQEFELEEMLSRWYKLSDHFLVSGIIENIFKKITERNLSI